MKNIIGMIHLSGDTTTSKIDTALKEIEIYEKHGLSGTIIENYHGNIAHVMFRTSKTIKTKNSSRSKYSS
jgi:predicted TIM-barrel enzyme